MDDSSDSGGDSRGVRLAPAGLLAAAIGLSFARALSRGPADLSGLFDAYQYFGPMAFYMDSVLHSGELPLWNPLLYCGMPFAANPQAALFYPPHLVRGLLNVDPTPFSTHVSMALSMGAHLLLAALGTLRLARSYGLSMGAAMTSALAFTLSAAMVRRVCEYHFVYTLAWLPWILLAVRDCFNAPHWRPRVRSATAVALLAAAAYLGGFLHIVPYMAIAVVVHALARGFLGASPSGRGATVPAARFPGLLALVAAALLAAGLAAVALLPAAELAGFTARRSGDAVQLYADPFVLPPLDLLQALVTFPGLQPAGSGIRGSGLLALVLALGACLHPARRAVAGFALAWLALVDCTFGPPMPLASLLERVLPFANSSHARAYDVALLPLAMLSGFGVDALRARLTSRPRLVRRAILVLGALLLVPLWIWTSPHRFVDTTLLVVALPALGLLTLARGPFLAWRLPAISIPGVLATLVFLETLAWNVGYADLLLRKHHLEPARRFEGAAQLPRDNVRGVDSLPNRELFALRPVMNGYDPLFLQRVQEVLRGGGPGGDLEYRRVVRPREPTAHSQRGNLFLKRSFWLARGWVQGPLPGRLEPFESTTAAFLSEPPPSVDLPRLERGQVVGHFLSGPGDPATTDPTPGFFEPVGPGQKIQRFATLVRPGGARARSPGPAGAPHTLLSVGYASTLSTTVRPRFIDDETGRRTYGIRTDVQPGEGTLEIACPDMPRARVHFELKTGPGEGSFAFTSIRAEVDPGDEDGRIAILERRANSVEVEVGPLEEARLLLHVDAAYPGWRAELDGEPVPILRANDAFKAVAVPRGTHRVRFTFVPSRVQVGAVVSALALALAVAAILISRPRRPPGAVDPVP